MASVMGVPNPPSFVPGFLTDFTDRMSFGQRLVNTLGYALYTPFFLQLADEQTAVFRHATHDRHFPSLIALAKQQTQAVFVNSVELLDYPRPTLANVVYVGGVGVFAQRSRPLSEVQIVLCSN